MRGIYNGSSLTYIILCSTKINNTFVFMREKMKDILLIISWRQFSRRYFDRSASWMYHKIDGIEPITDTEREKIA